MRLRPALLALPLLLAACSDPPPPAAEAPAAAAPAADVSAPGGVATDDTPAAPAGPTTAMPGGVPDDTVAAAAPPAGDTPGQPGATLADLATAQDTLATLRARHGEANVREEEISGAEGEVAQGWVLFPDDETRRVVIYLDDDQHPSTLEIDPPSTWTAGGLRIGMTATELAEANGRAFDFSGFGWDYGGAVIDWKGGRYHDRRISARLCVPEGEWPDDYPLGDGTFASTDPRLAGFMPTVCSLSVWLGELDTGEG